ncbi:hypothetical protein L916_04997 [Phytophthora nicotianae]|uniref:Uncharacterized protein n=1 Tax=Phytophthora nicotianae TaxID=4792 RepID=W2JGN7_PHYNI|nr:hypothetical protein L916_04997 [Phytophthora nicotianae]
MEDPPAIRRNRVAVDHRAKEARRVTRAEAEITTTIMVEPTRAIQVGLLELALVTTRRETWAEVYTDLVECMGARVTLAAPAAWRCPVATRTMGATRRQTITTKVADGYFDVDYANIAYDRRRLIM